MKNEYQVKREAERLARCTTDAQRAMVEQLHERNVDAWPEKRLGKSVIASFRRYLETCDASKIDNGLYEFSMHGGGGLNSIAHFSIDGFRSVYPHPAMFIEDLLIPQVSRWPESLRIDPLGYHSLHVYTDGLTSGHVAHAIIDLAAGAKERVYADWKRKHDAAALAEAERLADSLGMRLVPS